MPWQYFFIGLTQAIIAVFVLSLPIRFLVYTCTRGMLEGRRGHAAEHGDTQ